MLLLSFACTKQVAGPKGDPGTPAGKGNAKQTVSASFVISSTDWTISGSHYKALAFISEITDNVVANGEVNVFILSDGKWWPLPYMVGETFTQFSFEKGIIKLETYKGHGTPANPASANYKVVLYY